MLERLWRKRNTPLLPVGLQTGTTTLEINLEVPLSPQPLQHVLSPEILILAILTGERWNLKVILICISLIIDFEDSLCVSQPFEIPQL